jgi:phage terminase large subunit-like protein
MTSLYKLPYEEAAGVMALAAASIRAREGKAPEWKPYPHQVPPDGLWNVWLLMAGRGAGKTDAGAHYVDAHANGPACLPGKTPHRIAIVSTTHDDAVDTCVRGESGLLNVNRRIRFRPGAQLTADLTWPNGAEAALFGTFAPEDVERFRGPQHCLVWGDEVASWRKLEEAWDMIQFGLRLGSHPHIVLTTTPKGRRKFLEIMREAGTITVTARTDDNPALPFERREALYRKYGGTTIGRQELNAEILTEVAGALWKRAMIEMTRAPMPDLTRIVVAIDPSATSTESADECGIVVAGINIMGHGFVLEDLTQRTDPASWAAIAIGAYRRWKADRVIAETNNGGEMVGLVIHSLDSSVSYKAVTASRGKQTRAEPISALYEQGKVHHVGSFELLEDQMCQWIPGEKSPDRMDALVWALTELMIDDGSDPWAQLAGQRVGAVA